jgi:hypothetical protein
MVTAVVPYPRSPHPLSAQAPEQFQGPSAGEKVDQYAFGVLLWEVRRACRECAHSVMLRQQGSGEVVPMVRKI